MSFRPRETLLTSKQEEDLEWELRYWWNRELSASDIMAKLGIGVKDQRWEMLKRHHIYYYRRKFKLEPRVVRKSGETRYRIAPGEIEPPPLSAFVDRLDELYPLDIPIANLARDARGYRTYLLFHYWTPLRASEVYERVISDFKVISDPSEGDRLVIDNLFRKKKLTPKNAPFELPIDFPLVSEIVEWLQDRLDFTGDEDSYIFPWSTYANPGNKAWRIVKEAFPGSYPHYWRFKYITDGLSDPDTPLSDLKVETDLHVLTLEKYILTGSVQRADALRRRRRRRRKQEELETTTKTISDLSESEQS